MQEELGKYDNLFSSLDENFSKIVQKLYTRENNSFVTEVKEVYFGQNNRSKSNNLTFEINQVFTNLEKLVTFVEKEKQELLSKKETTMEQEEFTTNIEPLNDSELETLTNLLEKRISEQETYITEVETLHSSLLSLIKMNQL